MERHHVGDFKRILFRDRPVVHSPPHAARDGLQRLLPAGLDEELLQMRQRDLAAVGVPGFVEEVPHRDPGVGGIAADDFARHRVETLGGLRFIKERIVTDLVPTVAVRRIFPPAVIAPVVMLGAQLRHLEILVFRHHAVVAEADHQFYAVAVGALKHPLEARHESVVLTIPDDELQDHPDRVEADRRHELQLAVHRRQMFFEIQFLPEGDAVAAVGGQIIAPPQPRRPFVPIVRLCQTPL